MTRRDWLLLTLKAAGEAGLTPVQLQKVLFIVGKNAPTRDFYKFLAYNYGPFSALIYQDAERLEKEGLVEILTEGYSRRYKITDAGRKQARIAELAFPATLREYLLTLVEWVQSLSFSELVRAIYSKYPEYRVNSVFRE